MSCRACGATVPEDARFCPLCGHELVARGEERRVATVLFADLVGFTSLSETLDPEQVKRLVDQCFERLVADITSFGGVVDKIIGDAIVALFGAPVAHEDDAERAVRAALAMQHTLADKAAGLEADIQMRIGVNTGEVIVGALRAGGDYTAMGDVVNTASRIQTSASPGGVLVGQATYAATKGVIGYEPQGLLEARGRVAPVAVFLAEDAILPPGYRPRRHTPLVGRDQELGMLHHALNAAIERRRAHLILLVGEAGVGKTRLAEEVAEIAATSLDATVLEGRCVPYGEANVWWPVAEALRQAIGVKVDASFESAHDLTTDAVASVLGDADGEEIERVVAGLIHLLGYEGTFKGVDPARAMTEATQSVLTFIEASARDRPVVVVLSDLHWADDVVLEMIDALMDKLSRDRFVLIATARQELNDRWSVRAGRFSHLVIHLDPLDRDATAVLLDLLVDSDLPADVTQLLLDRSGGNPFFLEELVALVSESGVATAAGDGASASTRGGPRGIDELPDTLRGLLAARLDGLSGSERRLLEDAAVWGRNGTVDVLALMAEYRGRDDIDADLQALVDKDVLEVSGDHWQFRSDMVRDVAYGTLTKAVRAKSHYGIAKYFERHKATPGGADDRMVDVVAHHYATAAALDAELGGVAGISDEVVDEALVWVEEAAARAQTAQVLPVSIRMFGEAIALVGDEPSERRADLLLARAYAYAESRRLDEAQSDVEEAERLSLDLQYLGGLARAAFIRGEVTQHRGDLDDAIDQLSDAVALFEEAADRKGEADGLRAIGMAQIFKGDNAAAELSIAAGLEVSRELGDSGGEAWALQQMAWISFVQGRPAEAEHRLAQAAERFTALGDRGGLGWVNGLLAYVWFQQGRLDDARELGDAILVDARERGDLWALGMMLLLGSNVRLWSGATAAALPLAEEALVTFRGIADKLGEMQALAVTGRIRVMAGDVAAGLRQLEASASLVQRLGDDSAEWVGLIAQAGAAVQIGDPRQAATALGAVRLDEINLDDIGEVDRVVAAGLLRLQLGETDDAAELLEAAAVPVDGSTSGAYAVSALALARAAQGHHDEVFELQRRVNGMDQATYLDRGTAALAVALVQAREGDDGAISRFEAVVHGADATGDQVAQAVARLSQAYGMEALGHERAEKVRAEAEERLELLGIGAEGWRAAIESVLAASPTADAPAPAAST